MKKLGFVAAIALALSACATGYRGPVYEPARSVNDEGYSEVRIDDNYYRVQFRTDYNEPGLAQEWAMRRAAELTLQNRYDWFQVLRRSRAYSDDTFRRYNDYRLDNQYGDYPDYYERGAYDDRVAVIEVVMGNAPPPRGDSIYDARRLLDSMRRSRY